MLRGGEGKGQVGGQWEVGREVMCVIDRVVAGWRRWYVKGGMEEWHDSQNPITLPYPLLHTTFVNVLPYFSFLFLSSCLFYFICFLFLFFVLFMKIIFILLFLIFFQNISFLTLSSFFVLFFNIFYIFLLQEKV